MVGCIRDDQAAQSYVDDPLYDPKVVFLVPVFR